MHYLNFIFYIDSYLPEKYERIIDQHIYNYYYQINTENKLTFGNGKITVLMSSN